MHNNETGMPMNNAIIDIAVNPSLAVLLAGAVHIAVNPSLAVLLAGVAHMRLMIEFGSIVMFSTCPMRSTSWDAQIVTHCIIRVPYHQHTSIIVAYKGGSFEILLIVDSQFDTFVVWANKFAKLPSSFYT